MEMRSSYLIWFLFIIIFLTACSPTKDPRTGYPIVEQDIVLIIEPNLWEECPSHPAPRDCLIINGEGTYQLIEGFRHEEGVWKKVLVDKFENTDVTQGRLADANAFGFTLKENLDEIEERDLDPRRLCEFYEGQWTERARRRCAIENIKLQDKYCEHMSGEC